MFTRLIIMILLVATACTPTRLEESTPPQDIPASPTKDSTNRAATPSPVVDEEGGLQKKFSQVVLKDLAARLHVGVEEISVLAVEPIEWPSAALGCPSPGKFYAQGTVPGFRIRLEVDNNEYSYHTDRKGQFVLCPDNNVELPEHPSIPIEPGEIDDGEPWVPVD